MADSFAKAFGLALLLITGFVGPAFLVVIVGPLSLFPYRIVLMGLSVCVLVGWARSKDHSWRPNLNSPVILSAAAMAFAAITLLWTLDLGMGFRHLLLLGTGLGALLIVYSLARTETVLRWVVFSWCLGVGALLVIAYWEHVFGLHLAQSAFFMTQDVRLAHLPTATLFNPNNLAAFLALSLPFAAAGFRHAKGRILPWFGLLLSASAFYIILATGSRAALLAVICECVVLAVLSLRKNRAARRGWILLAALGAVFLATLYSPSIDVDRSLNMVVSIQGEELNSLAKRINLLRNGWGAMKSTYGLGVGIGGWEGWIDTSAVFDTEGMSVPHNWWLELGVSLGLPFLLAYIALYFRTLWRSWRARIRANSDIERMLTEIVLLSMVGFFFASLGPSSFLAFAPQWLLWGFALAVLAWVNRPRTAEHPS